WQPLYRLSLAKYRLCAYRRSPRGLGHNNRGLWSHLDGCIHSGCPGVFLPIAPSSSQYGKLSTKQTLAGLKRPNPGLYVEYYWAYYTQRTLVAAQRRSLLCTPKTKHSTSIHKIRPRTI